ncbi:hypothetical protein GCM10010295_13380 [Streptomyces intermedius]
MSVVVMGLSLGRRGFATGARPLRARYGSRTAAGRAGALGDIFRNTAARPGNRPVTAGQLPGNRAGRACPT